MGDLSNHMCDKMDYDLQHGSWAPALRKRSCPHGRVKKGCHECALEQKVSLLERRVRNLESALRVHQDYRKGTGRGLSVEDAKLYRMLEV